jgi:UDP-N-acetyl-2-amino-2-deoxyglucuronate dehydrogenase
MDELVEIEKKSGKKVYTVLQLRVHDSILAMKKKIDSESRNNYQVELKYITSRGQWYQESWKGDINKAGGLSTNIGVHFFDMLTWIFGKAVSVNVEYKDKVHEYGSVTLEKANVKWDLTIDRTRLPADAVKDGKTTFRSIKIDGEEFEFSEGFTELHKNVYQDILSGKGYGVEASRPALEIVEKIREM